MARKKIFQIVGYKNSGKTTLIELLIKACNQFHFSIGTIKHHGHGGLPTRTFIQKDTDKHRQAGAKVSSVEGAGTLYIEVEKPSWKLDEIIQLYKNFTLDMILIEGFKQASYPKVVLLRGEQDKRLLDELDHIQAVISQVPIEIDRAYPLYLESEKDLFIDWFVNQYVTKKED